MFLFWFMREALLWSESKVKEGKIIKLSDGKCYSYNTARDFKARNIKQSPFTRKAFTEADIIKINRASFLGGGGIKRKHKKTKRRIKKTIKRKHKKRTIGRKR